MMLIVIADIERDVIQRSIIGVSLVSLLEHVVFRDEVSSNWVKSQRQHSSHEKISNRSRAHCPVYGQIKHNLQHNHHRAHTLCHATTFLLLLTLPRILGYTGRRITDKQQYRQ